MRKLVIALVAFELLALSACGYALGQDRELTGAISWARQFKAEQPSAARAIAWGCREKIPAGALLSREGALKLIACIRREAQAQGYA